MPIELLAINMKYDGSWNYNHLPEPELMHLEAMAYADCAIELCKRMKQDEFECTFLRGQAALYLGFHSTELFLKAAILHKSGELIKGHKLRQLRERYSEIFPDAKYQIRTHFQTTYMGYTEEEVADFIKNEKPTDQKLRYPIDKDKKKWWKSESFDAPACLEQFRSCREAMERVGLEVYKNEC